MQRKEGRGKEEREDREGGKGRSKGHPIFANHRH